MLVTNWQAVVGGWLGKITSFNLNLTPVHGALAFAMAAAKEKKYRDCRAAYQWHRRDSDSDAAAGALTVTQPARDVSWNWQSETIAMSGPVTLPRRLILFCGVAQASRKAQSSANLSLSVSTTNCCTTVYSMVAGKLEVEGWSHCCQ